ncbi:MAG: Mur ligase family protein [Pseudomonadota bacterium]
MKITDVRRLTGTSFLLNRPGAAAEVTLPPEKAALFVSLWRQEMACLLSELAWSGEELAARLHDLGASLAMTAPVDGLYVACDMIEWGCEAARTRLQGNAPDGFEKTVAEFQQAIAKDHNPALRDLTIAAARHRVSLLEEDGVVSLGLGVRSQRFALGDLPLADQVDWQGIGDIPVAMVTGTNGKSTTVRLTAAIGRAAGHSVGLCSSDWVRVGDEIVDEGDYSGPAGATMAARDPRVELAVLEVARGGLMRRGLAIERAKACAITNIAPDHLGTYGITDVDALADAKFLLSKAVVPEGRLILNRDDPALVRRSAGFDGSITWYGMTLSRSDLAGWIAAGQEAVFVEDGHMVLAKGGDCHPVLAIDDFPAGMKGAARYNVSNALAAIGLAAALELPLTAMAKGLAEFENSPAENPGRGNLVEVGGLSVLVDFAHNPHGLAALIETYNALPAERRIYLIGQAGDRRDEDIRELTRIVWQERPEMIVIKDLPTKLRGRQLGEVPALIEAELRDGGASPEAYVHAGTELEGVRQSLRLAREGDLLILLVHVERKETMALMGRLAEVGWKAGEPLPE